MSSLKWRNENQCNSNFSLGESYLALLYLLSAIGVNGNEENEEENSCEGGDAQLHVQEDDHQNYLKRVGVQVKTRRQLLLHSTIYRQRVGPRMRDVADDVYDLLAVHRDEVGDLARRILPSRVGREHQGLLVQRRHQAVAKLSDEQHPHKDDLNISNLRLKYLHSHNG